MRYWMGDFCMGCYQAGYSCCVKSIPQDKLPFEDEVDEYEGGIPPDDRLSLLRSDPERLRDESV